MTSVNNRVLVRAIVALAIAGSLAAPTAVEATAVKATTVATTQTVFQPASDRDGQISRQEVVSRAQFWVDHQPGDYDQKGYAPGPDDPDRKYRRDCSGYVSMTWHTGQDHWTGSLDQIGTKIDRKDLQPGDIFLYPGTHTFLFAGWTNDKGDFKFYSFGATPVTTGVTNINARVFDGHPNDKYHTVRYNKIV